MASKTQDALVQTITIKAVDQASSVFKGVGTAAESLSKTIETHVKAINTSLGTLTANTETSTRKLSTAMGSIETRTGTAMGNVTRRLIDADSSIGGSSRKITTSLGHITGAMANLRDARFTLGSELATQATQVERESSRIRSALSKIGTAGSGGGHSIGGGGYSHASNPLTFARRVIGGTAGAMGVYYGMGAVAPIVSGADYREFAKNQALIQGYTGGTSPQEQAATKKLIQQYSQQFLTQAPKKGVDPTQAIAAMYYIASSVKGPQQIGLLSNASVNLAAAGFQDPTQTAQFLTQLSNSYGPRMRGARNVTSATNAINQAIRIGNMEPGQLPQMVTPSLGTASMLGITPEQMLAMASMLSTRFAPTQVQPRLSGLVQSLGAPQRMQIRAGQALGLDWQAVRKDMAQGNLTQAMGLINSAVSGPAPTADQIIDRTHGLITGKAAVNMANQMVSEPQRVRQIFGGNRWAQQAYQTMFLGQNAQTFQNGFLNQVSGPNAAGSLGQSIGVAVNSPQGQWNKLLAEVKAFKINVEKELDPLRQLMEKTVGGWLNSIQSRMPDIKKAMKSIGDGLGQFGNGFKIELPSIGGQWTTLLADIKDLATYLGIIGGKDGQNTNNFLSGLGKAAGIAVSGGLALLDGVVMGIKDSLEFWKPLFEPIISLLGKLGGEGKKSSDSMSGLNTALRAIGIFLGIFGPILLAYLAIVKVITIAQIAWNLAMTANPIGVIVVALAALVVGVIYLYNNWKPFHEFVQAAFARMREFANWIAGTFGPVMDKMGNALGKVIDFVSQNWKTIGLLLTGPIGLAIIVFQKFGPTVLKHIQDAVNTVTGWVKDHWKDIVDLFENPFGTIGKFIDGLAPGWEGKAKNLIGAFITGVKNKAGDLGNAIKNAIGDAIGGAIKAVTDHMPDWLKNMLGIGSSTSSSTPGSSSGGSTSGLFTPGQKYSVLLGPANETGQGYFPGDPMVAHDDFQTGSGKQVIAPRLPGGDHYHVVFAGYEKEGGNTVAAQIVTSQGEVVGAWDVMHLMAAPAVQTGQNFGGQTLLGISGNTGAHTTGAHLHVALDQGAANIFNNEGYVVPTGFSNYTDYWHGGSGGASNLPKAVAQWTTYLQQASKATGIPVSVLAAVMNTESGGRNGQTSGAGAQGLMQVMPFNDASLGITNPWDPKQNIMGGAKLLAQYVKASGGNYRNALAMYNAGSAASSAGQYYAGTVLSTAHTYGYGAGGGSPGEGTGSGPRPRQRYAIFHDSTGKVSYVYGSPADTQPTAPTHAPWMYGVPGAVSDPGFQMSAMDWGPFAVGSAGRTAFAHNPTAAEAYSGYMDKITSLPPELQQYFKKQAAGLRKELVTEDTTYTTTRNQDVGQYQKLRAGIEQRYRDRNTDILSASQITQASHLAGVNITNNARDRQALIRAANEQSAFKDKMAKDESARSAALRGALTKHQAAQINAEYDAKEKTLRTSHNRYMSTQEQIITGQDTTAQARLDNYLRTTSLRTSDQNRKNARARQEAEAKLYDQYFGTTGKPGSVTALDSKHAVKVAGIAADIKNASDPAALWQTLGKSVTDKITKGMDALLFGLLTGGDNLKKFAKQVVDGTIAQAKMQNLQDKASLLVEEQLATSDKYTKTQAESARISAKTNLLKTEEANSVASLNLKSASYLTTLAQTEMATQQGNLLQAQQALAVKAVLTGNQDYLRTLVALQIVQQQSAVLDAEQNLAVQASLATNKDYQASLLTLQQIQQQSAELQAAQSIKVSLAMGDLSGVISAAGQLLDINTQRWTASIEQGLPIQNDHLQAIKDDQAAITAATDAQNEQSIVLGMILGDYQKLSTGLQAGFTTALDKISLWSSMVGRSIDGVKTWTDDIGKLAGAAIKAATNLATIDDVISGLGSVKSGLLSAAGTEFMRSGSINPATVAGYQQASTTLTTANADQVYAGLYVSKKTPDITTFMDNLGREINLWQDKLHADAATYGEHSTQVQHDKDVLKKLQDESDGLNFKLQELNDITGKLTDTTGLSADDLKTLNDNMQKADDAWAIFTGNGIDPAITAIQEMTGLITPSATDIKAALDDAAGKATTLADTTVNLKNAFGDLIGTVGDLAAAITGAISGIAGGGKGHGTPKKVVDPDTGAISYIWSDGTVSSTPTYPGGGNAPATGSAGSATPQGLPSGATQATGDTWLDATGKPHTGAFPTGVTLMGYASQNGQLIPQFNTIPGVSIAATPGSGGGGSGTGTPALPTGVTTWYERTADGSLSLRTSPIPPGYSSYGSTVQNGMPYPVYGNLPGTYTSAPGAPGATAGPAAPGPGGDASNFITGYTNPDGTGVYYNPGTQSTSSSVIGAAGMVFSQPSNFGGSLDQGVGTWFDWNTGIAGDTQGNLSYPATAATNYGALPYKPFATGGALYTPGGASTYGAHSTSAQLWGPAGPAIGWAMIGGIQWPVDAAGDPVSTPANEAAGMGPEAYIQQLQKTTMSSWLPPNATPEQIALWTKLNGGPTVLYNPMDASTTQITLPNGQVVGPERSGMPPRGPASGFDLGYNISRYLPQGTLASRAGMPGYGPNGEDLAGPYQPTILGPDMTNYVPLSMQDFGSQYTTTPDGILVRLHPQDSANIAATASNTADIGKSQDEIIAELRNQLKIAQDDLAMTRAAHAALAGAVDAQPMLNPNDSFSHRQ